MIALTIDVEQWNCPLLEGKQVEENDDTSFSRIGNERLLELLRSHEVKSTFFVTGFFAEKEPDNLKRIQSEGHEIGCHGFHHYWRGNKELNIQEEVRSSKSTLEKMLGTKMKGFRAPQLQYSEELISVLHEEGFQYDSSLHPTFIPGAYNHLRSPQEIFQPISECPVKEIPLAVSPLRMPINWLFMRLFGIERTIHSCKQLLKKGITPVLYIHSWELVKMTSKNVPWYYTYRTGDVFMKDIERLLTEFGSKEFTTLEELTRPTR